MNLISRPEDVTDMTGGLMYSNPFDRKTTIQNTTVDDAEDDDDDDGWYGMVWKLNFCPVLFAALFSTDVRLVEILINVL